MTLSLTRGQTTFRPDALLVVQWMDKIIDPTSTLFVKTLCPYFNVLCQHGTVEL